MFKSARREAVENRLKLVINLHHMGKPQGFITDTLSISLEFVKAAVIVNYDQPTYHRRLLEKIQRKSRYRCRITGSLLRKPVWLLMGTYMKRRSMKT
jgi:hypothetical protein